VVVDELVQPVVSPEVPLGIGKLMLKEVARIVFVLFQHCTNGLVVMADPELEPSIRLWDYNIGAPPVSVGFTHHGGLLTVFSRFLIMEEETMSNTDIPDLALREPAFALD
jgi:hypothetical protein